MTVEEERKLPVQQRIYKCAVRAWGYTCLGQLPILCHAVPFPFLVP